jgi:phosphotransferase system HPr (HPr) family protein
MKEAFSPHMQEITLVVKHAVGLHARPARLFVQTAKKFKSKILVSKGEREENGKSITSVLMLSASQGAVITIKANGEDEEAALKALQELVENNFGESLDARPASPPHIKCC